MKPIRLMESVADKEMAKSAARAFGETIDTEPFDAHIRLGEDGFELRLNFEYHGVLIFDKLTPEKLYEAQALVRSMREMITKLVDK